MNPRTRLLTALAAIVLVVAVLAVALAQCGARPAPATETPGATTAAATHTPADAATEEPRTPTATPGPTPTSTEGEKAAEAVGQEYIAYRPTQGECEQAVDSGDVEACVWLDSAQLITRTEWGLLFPNTDFYLLEMGGYRPDSHRIYDSRHRLVAMHDGRHYTAETFDRLLEANGITAITDENRELVGQAFALMTIPGYLEKDVVFTKWEAVNLEPAAFNYCATAWTQLQGLELLWCFIFWDEQLDMASGPMVQQVGTGDYIDVYFEALPHPSREDYRFSGDR